MRADRQVSRISSGGDHFGDHLSNLISNPSAFAPTPLEGLEMTQKTEQGLASGFGDVSLSMLDGDDEGGAEHSPSSKIFFKVFDSLGAVADFAVVTRVLVALLATFAFFFGLALAAMPSSAHAATAVKDVPLCEHDVAPVDVGLHARNVAASKVVKTWMQPKGDEITMKAKAGKKLVDVICRTAKEREYALDTYGRVYDTACGNQIVKGYTIPIDVKPVVPAPAPAPAPVPAPKIAAPAPTALASAPKIWYQVEKGTAPLDCQCSIPATKANHGGKDFPGAFFPGLEGRECQVARKDFATRHKLAGV